ncbi:MAG: CDP-alcohol phosphatidyltransferase family protein [Geminicoccaceae bacterium]|nr:CDP-alcohol phosphatidyltransferase family protein [Geminicoccaceae bacterium]MCB9967783.1 CDP-alcohol phosphatidyltransferase family protein [Geminicoccaceae bacterium]HRY24152.1 CDP-alcohol phosphatidyltransferase family protein [Geminicoccaceae bacterium]
MTVGRSVAGSGRRGGWRDAAALGGSLLPAAIAALTLARVGGLPWLPGVLLVGLVTSGVLATLHANGHRRPFGLANGVTLLRLDLAACLLAAVWVGPEPLPLGARPAWAVFALAALALALDGIDGWLARRRGEASAFGARFDMASDTFLAIVLALCAWRFVGLAPWVLAIGLLRPAFVTAGLAWPRLAAPLPPSRWRRAACGTALLLLVMTLAPPLARVAPWLAAGSLLILLHSFGRDIRRLLDRRQTA